MSSQTPYNPPRADEQRWGSAAADAPAERGPRPSRRSLLRGAAGAGAIGLAAAAGAGAAVAVTHSSSDTLQPAAKPVALTGTTPADMTGPLVIYISDAASGMFDVFGGTGQVRIKNPALVSQLVKNVKQAW